MLDKELCNSNSIWVKRDSFNNILLNCRDQSAFLWPIALNYFKLHTKYVFSISVIYKRLSKMIIFASLGTTPVIYNNFILIYRTIFMTGVSTTTKLTMLVVDYQLKVIRDVSRKVWYSHLETVKVSQMLNCVNN